MLAFTWWTEIERYAETPANRVGGPFCCLMEDVAMNANQRRAERILWQVIYESSERHPRAIARSPRPACPNDCDPFMVEAAAAVWGSRSATEAGHVFRCAAIPITEAEVRAGLVLAEYYAGVRDNNRRCAGVPAY